jgi:hypothetical protein
VITSAHTAKVTVGSNFSYTISATNNPTSFGASGLPAGLSVDTALGVISGVPQSTGTFTLSVSAANAAGAGINPLILTIVSVADGRTNVALNTNGANAVASSEYFNGANPAADAITGDRSGANWSTGTGGWMANTYGVYPVWLEVDFPGVKNIAEVDVYSLQDNYTPPLTPTADMTFSRYGLTDFEVQTYFGSAWVDVPGGHITGNNLVWRQIAFAPISTAKIRIQVNRTADGWTRITDVEAYESTTLPAAPVITSPTSATGTVGSGFSYTITATNNPTSYNAAGLPAGLSVSTMTGVISGIPQSVGTSNVTLSATNTGGTGTILLIIGVSAPSPTSSAKFITLDALTQGSWKGVYGAEGFAINSDGINYPNYAQVSLSASAQSYVWPASYVDVRSLQQSAGSGRIASTWFSAGAFAIDMNLTDGTAHQVAVYAEDVDGYDGPRSETIEVRDAATSALLDSRSISNFGGGQYLVWTMQGHVVINVINTRPTSNALVNGFFFGGAGGSLSRH